MRILLINSNRYKTPPVIPLGLCYVAAAIEDAGHEVYILDLCFVENCAKEIANTITETHPDIVGISIRNIDNSSLHNPCFLLNETKKQVIVPCKESFSGPIVIGGPSVGISGAEMLSFLELDLAIRGDGEVAMVELINRLEKKLPLDGLGGLVIRKEGRIIEDNPPMFVANLNSLPIAKPDRYLDLQPYFEVNASIPIQTKRGCALKCTYCTYKNIEGHNYRLRDPKIIADEIEGLVKRTGIKDIEFTDSTFNVPPKHAKSILRAIATKNLNLNLSTAISPVAIDEELADLMKEAHFQVVVVSAEAGCDAMLKSLGKNYTKNDLFRTGKLLRERGIPIVWCMLLGASGETKQTLMETFDTMDKVVSYWDTVSIATGIRVYKNTPISRIMQNENPAMDCTKDNYLQPIFYSPQTLSLKEIDTIVKQITLKKRNYQILGEGD